MTRGLKYWSKPMEHLSREQRSKIMSCVKSSHNKSTELQLIKIFRKYSISGWCRNYPLFGKPDFVFLKKRVVIFVDGCFWHACKKHLRLPSSNFEYWSNKINSNLIRDKKVNKELKLRGWKVVRIWEHEINKTKLPNKLKLLLGE